MNGEGMYTTVDTYFTFPINLWHSSFIGRQEQAHAHSLSYASMLMLSFTNIHGSGERSQLLHLQLVMQTCLQQVGHCGHWAITRQGCWHTKAHTLA